MPPKKTTKTTTKSLKGRGGAKTKATSGSIDLSSFTSNMCGATSSRGARRKKQAIANTDFSAFDKPVQVDKSGGHKLPAVSSPIRKEGSGQKKRQQVNQTPDNPR